MNVDEAKLILQAARPGDEAGADPQLAAAQALLRSDPALAAWYAGEQRWDGECRRALAAVPVPPDLPAQILARSAVEKVVPLPADDRSPGSFSWRAPRVWAMAAVILLFLGLSLQWLRPQPIGPWADFARDMIAATPHDERHVDLKNSDFQQVRGWLAAHHGPADLGLPPVMYVSPGLTGCRVTHWHGRPVSMLCFMMPGKHHVDLFVTPVGAITDVPDPGQPVFAAIAGQMAVAWRAGANVYLLTGPVPEDFLRHCLEPSAGAQAARPVMLGTVY
jgi:hypothetical protein